MVVTHPLSGLISGKFCFKLRSTKLSPGFCLNCQGWRICILWLQTEFTNIKASLDNTIIEDFSDAHLLLLVATRCGAVTLKYKDRKEMMLQTNVCCRPSRLIDLCGGAVLVYSVNILSFIKLEIVHW